MVVFIVVFIFSMCHLDRAQCRRGAYAQSIEPGACALVEGKLLMSHMHKPYISSYIKHFQQQYCVSNIFFKTVRKSEEYGFSGKGLTFQPIKSKKHCFLLPDWLKFVTLHQKYRIP